ncbi:sigma-70 family RNA polymerase sigma factor [Nannocystis sp. SCPEA4]|uniref:RNA polymerase sigma factor n=1 Tax=Nannocystis sp. SCPEA4 TaxID=2996787 RepID=UPI0022718530|nr:sigma-70 family RNA polymerase sigma factor [Nannocystis sp. SCPEA4]MCY1057604.1 sigma-70 family RNA polymerase sigma factor [Nannocystis sp. SCPEA4]
MRSEQPDDDARIRTFRELYLAEFAFVWATARRYGVPPTLVEDAVQDVFMTAYRRLDQVRFEVSARAWLHGVTRRIAARYRRTAARLSRRLAAVAAIPSGPADPPQDRLAAAEQLERLLARLGGSTRAAFEMSELFGMTGPEIAGELGIPVATVYSRVRMAREQLQRELGGPGLERELAAARAREAPPPAVAQRSWAAMLPGLMSTRTSLGLAALVSARTAVMTTLVLAAGVVAIAWPKGQPRSDASSAVASPTPVAAEITGNEPAAELIAMPPEPPAVDPPAPPQPPGRVRPPLAPAGEPPVDADELAAEVALLDRARAELARGAVGAARARLAEHVQRFPAGHFADLRGATEVELLCREGDRAAAVARAVALVAAHPRSAVAQRFHNFSCPE